VEQFDGLCCIKGCSLPVLAVGMCNKHWRRNKKYGSPVLLERPAGSYRGPADQRFFMQFARPASGCWNWSNSKDKDGYGMFRGEWLGVTYTRAHRFSWAFHNNAAIPDGQLVLHSCDNPSCVNPAHLRLGDHGENQRERRAKGRHTMDGSIHRPRSKLTADAVREIRASSGPQDELARRFGVSQCTISDVLRRRTWTDI